MTCINASDFTVSFKLFAKNRQQILRAGAPILPDFPCELNRVSLVSLLSKSSANRSTYYPSFYCCCCFSKYFDSCQKISEVFFCQNKVVVFCIFFRRNQRFDKIGMSVFIYLLLMYFKFFSHLKWLSKIFNVNTYISTYLLKKYLQESCQMLFRCYY